MSKEILLALDGSAKDDRAIAVAESVAGLSGAPLQLVRVVDETGDANEEGRALTEIARRVAEDIGRRVTSEILRARDVAAALIRHASEHDALLVAMATRAAGAMDRTLRGSVADLVMRECPTPVLLIPPGTADMAGKQIQFSRVLVPLDGSALAVRALEYILLLPGASALEFVLLEVVSSDGKRAAAEARLDSAAQRTRAAGAAIVETDVADSDEAAPAIVHAVREELVDLIAMSSRGNGGAKRMVMGSVAEQVVRASEVPVLLLTPASLSQG